MNRQIPLVIHCILCCPVCVIYLCLRFFLGTAIDVSDVKTVTLIMPCTLHILCYSLIIVKDTLASRRVAIVQFLLDCLIRKVAYVFLIFSHVTIII